MEDGNNSKDILSEAEYRPAAPAKFKRNIRKAWVRRKKRKAAGKRRGRIPGFLLLTYIFAFFAACIAAVMGAGHYVVSSYIDDLPPMEEITLPRSKQKTQIFSSGGELIAELYLENREVVPVKDIPQTLKDAFVAIEDERFYRHRGFDVEGMGRALKLFISSHGKKRHGASTLTQQLARNVYLRDDLEMEKTLSDKLSRKLKEILVSIAIERKYSKDEILGQYMNVVYFGHGAHGVKTAAKIYFDKDLDQLTVAECAMLAALLKAPAHYTPYFHPDSAKKRRDTVIAKMHELGFISTGQREAAAAEEFHLSELRGPYYKNYKAPHFVTYVIDMLLDPDGEFRFTAPQLYGNGYRIYTTIDLEAQEDAEEAVKKGLEMAKERGAKVSQGALLSLKPLTGGIVAMVGGADYEQSKFNRTYQALRQPGSAFKPFVYITALKEGFSMDSTLLDEKSCFDAYRKDYCPGNYDHRYSGEITLHDALRRSRNVPAVKLAHVVGLENVVETAREMGITTELEPYPSIALGSFEVKMIDMVAAYASLAVGGHRVEPFAVEKIDTLDGREVYRREYLTGEKVLDDNVVSRIVPVLEDVIESGTGRGARFGAPAAGKTGTTNNYQDAWFVGFTPDLATAVWYGNDDNSAMGRIAGGTIPAPVWGMYMKEALADAGPRDFKLPEPDPMKAVAIETAPATGTLLFDPEMLAINREVFFEPESGQEENEEDLFRTIDSVTMQSLVN